MRTQILNWALHRSASTLAAVHEATPLVMLHLIQPWTSKFPSCRCGLGLTARLGFTPRPTNNELTRGSLSYARKCFTALMLVQKRMQNAFEHV